MQRIDQSPQDPDFIQNPYPFYQRARQQARKQASAKACHSGGTEAVLFWQDYNMPCVFDHQTMSALFKDRRLGRECPAEFAQVPAPHIAAFYALEAHSMLELEPPRHTRLRGLVLRAFTSRRIAQLAPEITALAQELIAQFPDGPFDLIDNFCTKIPVIIIARLLGVPETMADQLLIWSHDMVMMYQAGRSYEDELRAARSCAEFSDFMAHYIEQRRTAPADDLITHLIAAKDEGGHLGVEELISTCILLLNAGHEATVHTIGNGVKTLLEHSAPPDWFAPHAIEATVEEILRFDPPLHMFTRYVYTPMEIAGMVLQRGQQIGLLIGASARDPALWDAPDRFDPRRKPQRHLSFGGGIHFCVGAALARLELQIVLPILFKSCPNLRIVTPPRYAPKYHFHGLSELIVAVD